MCTDTMVHTTILRSHLIFLEKKARSFFEGWEITGSQENAGPGSTLVRKFALTKWIQDTFMGDLQRFCQELEAKTGKKIHVRGQWDNASPHTDCKLRALIAELFEYQTVH